MCARHEESPENVVFSGLECGKQDLKSTRTYILEQFHHMM